MDCCGRWGGVGWNMGWSCAMMGLQATAGKRKLEGGVGCMEFDMDMGESPSKLGRVEGSWYLEREMERDRSPPPMEPVIPAPMAQLQPPEQGRLTPFPMPPTSSGETDADSGIGDSDDSRSINWGSVLSLSISHFYLDFIKHRGADGVESSRVEPPQPTPQHFNLTTPQTHPPNSLYRS
ncbi:hypothetical protein M0802_012219 [Mischocyttarus mexicanus]|nr:hypothetical protein M0802_012219 [Mischocyttarus mexicanus]